MADASSDEIVAACKAIEAGKFDQARHHVNNLSALGTNPEQAQNLNRLIYAKEFNAHHKSMNRLGTALSVAAFGYAILSILQPPSWGLLPWGLAVFLVLPCFVGALAGSSVGPEQTSPAKSTRFWRAFWVTGVAVACYTIIGMGIARHRMLSSDKSMDVLIFVTVAILYGIMAGLVSGVAGAISVPRRRAS